MSKQNWEDGNDYNGGKDKFIKTEEAKAIKWYKNQESSIQYQEFSIKKHN